MKNVIICKATPTINASLCVIKLSGDNLEISIKNIIKDKLIHKKVINTNLYIKENFKINDTIVIFFKKPNSFTGEDVIEIHTYGNEFIVNSIINKIIKLGAKLAKPGEFLERRYLNGKITLLECELINKKINFNIENIVEFKDIFQKNIFLSIIKNANFRINLLIICIETSHFYNYDPVYNDFIFIKNFLKRYKKLLNILIFKVDKMNILKESTYFLIVGRRNVGKSTLFNKLSLRYKSIISNIAGTTRDLIDSKVKIGNKNLFFLDSAGLKIKTKSLVEKIGILKYLNNINNNYLIYISDKYNIKEIFFNLPILFYKLIKIKKIIILINKIDLNKIRKGIYKLKKIYFMFLSIKYNILLKNLKCFINKILTKNEFKKKVNIFNIKILYYNFKSLYKDFYCNFDILINNLLLYQKKMFKINGYYSNKQIRNSFFRNFCIGK